MTDPGTIKDMQARIDKLEKDIVGLTAISNRITNEFARFVATTEERFSSQNSNMHSAIRRQSHF